MDALKGLTSDVEGSPDLKYVVDTLIQIFEYISTDEMLELKKKDKMEYDKVLTMKFNEFSEKQFSLFSVVLAGEYDSMTHLVMMIKTLGMVKTGQITMDTAYAHIREELSNKYIYPQFGGKKQFEKAIRDRNNVKKHK